MTNDSHVVNQCDLTGSLFEHLDLSEAILRCHYESFGASATSIDVWGTIFHLNDYPINLRNLLPDRFRQIDVVYIAGWSRLTFHNVEAVSASVTPYFPAFDKGAAFLQMNGENVRVQRRWGSDANISRKYHIDCVMEYPFGYANLSIYSAGSVSMSLNFQEIVSTAEFVSNPRKFGWWEIGRYRSFALEGA
jgi:hypothetical protein